MEEEMRKRTRKTKAKGNKSKRVLRSHVKEEMDELKKGKNIYG